MVIPAEARKALGIEAGDKMVIFGHGRDGRLVVVKAEVVTEHVSRALGDLTALEAQLREELGAEGRGEEAEETS
jgi:AbrB family looped-hinge helix DNA binding protein